MPAPLTIAQRVASIEADIFALTQQKRAYEQVVGQAHETRQAGQQVAYDAGLQEEFAELMLSVIEGQLEEQWKARDALVPPQRQADA